MARDQFKCRLEGSKSTLRGLQGLEMSGCVFFFLGRSGAMERKGVSRIMLVTGNGISVCS